MLVLWLILWLAGQVTASGLRGHVPGGLKVPAFLDCDRRAGFASAWEVFRDRAALNARSGWPLDAALAIMALRLLEEYDDVSTGRSWVHPAGAVWESFRSVGGRPDEQLLPSAVQVVPVKAATSEAPMESLLIQTALGASRGHNCLYGLMTALFIAYRHDVAQGTEDATRHLDLILWLLGETEGGEQMFDFAESTHWPVRSIDVELNLQLAKSSSPRFVLFTRLQSWIPRRHVPPSIQRSPSIRLSALRIAVFGVHGATSMEPASAVQAAWALQGQAVSVRYYGHPCPRYEKTLYLCEWAKALPSGSSIQGDDPVAELLLEMVNMSQHEKSWDLHDALAKLGQLRQRDEYMRGADVWICSGPAALCALLHSLSPSQPLLFWHCRHLLDGLGAQPNSTATALLALLRSMESRSSTSCIACETFAAKQFSWQLALPEPPVHRRLALYVKEHRWSGADAYPDGYPDQVLVLRSMLWSRLPGLYFRTILEAFVRTNREALQLQFRFANDFGLLPYEEIAKHRCSVLIPNDLTMATFPEAYAMGLPIFLPQDEWLYRLQKSVPYGFMVYDGRLPQLNEPAESGGEPPPFWAQKQRSMPAVLHWLSTSDYSTWPHVQRFASIPQLLHDIAEADMKKLSHGMLCWLQEGQSSVLPRWAAAVSSILPSSTWWGFLPTNRQTEAFNGSGIGSCEEEGQQGDFAGDFRSDALYAGMACEHDSFDPAWNRCRAAVEACAALHFKADIHRAFEVIDSDFFSSHRCQEEESQLQSWNALFRFFLSVNQSALSTADTSVLGLGGHCHLGSIVVSLLRAWQFLLQPGGGEMSRCLQMASTLMQTVQTALGTADMNAYMPVGTWPIEDLMAEISNILDSRIEENRQDSQAT